MECREAPWVAPHLRGTRNGYAKMRIKDGKQALLHRWVWEQINGPIPPGMVVRHTCDNSSCFLYAHLVLGTYADNSADMVGRGRARQGPGRQRSDLCKRGHPIAERPSGHRFCPTCAQQAKRRRRLESHPHE